MLTVMQARALAPVMRVLQQAPPRQALPKLVPVQAHRPRQRRQRRQHRQHRQHRHRLHRRQGPIEDVAAIVVATAETVTVATATVGTATATVAVSGTGRVAVASGASATVTAPAHRGAARQGRDQLASVGRHVHSLDSARRDPGTAAVVAAEVVVGAAVVIDGGRDRAHGEEDLLGIRIEMRVTAAGGEVRG